MIDEHDFVMTNEVLERIKHSIHDEPYNYQIPSSEELSKLPGFENLDPPQRILKFLNDDELMEKCKVPNEQYIEGYKEKK
mgnify:CR=1 FL=1